MSEIRRPRQSACINCSKSRKPFCRFKCIDTILGPEWSPKDIGSKPPIDATLGPPKKRRKKNDGSAAASSSKRPLAPPAKSIRIIRATPADSPVIEPRSVTQLISSHAADSAPLAVTSETNDLLRMIVNELDLNHLLEDKIDAQKSPGQ